MSSREFPYTRAVITGASAGIGAALARRLTQEGVRELTIVARRIDRLQALASELEKDGETVVTCVAADLSTADGLHAVIEATPDTDLLINNAGFGSFGPFHRLDPQREGAMIALNCSAPVALTRHFLPGMVARQNGAVLHVASGQSFGAMPYMSTYAATKAFLLNWAEATRAELRGSGVRVVTVCPGAIDTEFNSSASIPSGLDAISLVSGSLTGVVDTCISAIESDRGISIPGIRNWLAVMLGRVSPRAISCWVLARLLRREAEQACD